MPCFQAERTSSQEYRWNSTSWPEGVPRKKNGSSTAKAAAAIERSGAHVRLMRRSPNCTAGDVAPSDCPDFAMVASFAYQPPCGDTYLKLLYMFAQRLERRTNPNANDIASFWARLYSSTFNIPETIPQQSSASVLALGWNRPRRLKGPSQTGPGSSPLRKQPCRPLPHSATAAARLFLPVR